MPEISKTISHYKIIAKLDAGGMRGVYHAEDAKLKRQVARVGKKLPIVCLARISHQVSSQGSGSVFVRYIEQVGRAQGSQV